MKAMKRLAAMLLALVLFVGLLPATMPEANAAISTSTFATKVQSFISDSRWKNGIAWGDSQTPKLSKWSSTGCCAYAADFVAYVYGSTSAAWTSSDFTKFTDLNEIRAGDIIHTTGHWFVVLERNGDTLRTVEGNFDDKVRVSSDGWGIKNGKIYNLKASSGERTFEYGYHYNFSDSSTTTTYSSSQIYHNIDMSAAVLASRTNQQVSGDCAVVSMATIEAYMYGATSTSEKKTVYNALVSKNGDNDYAYWSNCGYVSHSSINWTTVYENLSKGYPVIVHRPASGSKVEHWAVVAGYKGSTTTLEKDKFTIVDVYHGSGGTDIYTSGSWRGSVSIDRMVTRKNGIAITSLPGIRMAINHPAKVHQYGNGHGVYGYVTSNANLTSVQIKVTNAVGTAVYNKTLTPNAKSYLIYNLDSEMTFAKWAKGKYTYTVTAKTASSSRTYQYSFEIASGWPVTEAQQSYVFTFNANGGTGAPANQTVYFDGTLHIPVATPTREGYTFLGWYAQRNGDQTWYSAGNGWNTEAQLTASGYTKRLYPTDTDFIINNSWLSGCTDTTGFTFYAVWEKNAVNTYTVSYNANGGSGSMPDTTVSYGTPTALRANAFIRSGYTFGGWNAYRTSDQKWAYANSGGTIGWYLEGQQPSGYTKYTYIDKASVSQTSAVDKDVVIMYAVWNANSYTVTYNANGGSGAPASQTKTHDVSLTLSSTKPTRSGYTFLGWATSSSAASAAYQPGAAFTANANTTLYAVWKANTYTVTYNANGGSGAPASQTKTAGTALTLSSVKPTREGYTFKGWATSASGSVAYQPGSSFTANADTTLYAVWEQDVVSTEPQIIVESKTAAAGGKVTLDLKLKNNPGFSVLNVAFIYDSQYLSLTNVENKASALTMTYNTAAVWDAAEDYTNDGILATLTFEIAETAPDGDYEIQIVFMGASNSDFENVTMCPVYGSVRVASTVYGDVNGDGQVTTVDLAMLRKYMASKDPITGESSVAVKAGADCNGDGSTGTVDLAMLRKYLASKDPVTGESSVVLGPK